MIQYPKSPRNEGIADTYHGVSVTDPYRWLEDIGSDGVKEWIEAQNSLTETYLDQIPARAAIRKRMAELYDCQLYDLPREHGGRYFFTRRDGLKDQPALCWTDNLEAEPKVLLDPNELSDDGTVALRNWEVNKDGTLVAYGLISSGTGWQEYKIREVDTGRDLPDFLKWIWLVGVKWDHNGEGLFYERMEEPSTKGELLGKKGLPGIYYHKIGTSQSEDEIIYERPDHPDWSYSFHPTSDGHYIVILPGTSSLDIGIIVKDISTVDADVIDITQGLDSRYGFVGDDGAVLYFKTDFNAPNSRVVAIDLREPDRGKWRDIIPESADVLSNVDLVGEYIFATYIHDAYHRVYVYNKGGERIRELDLPGKGSVSYFQGRSDQTKVFFWYSDYTTPQTILSYDVKSDKIELIKRLELDFDSTMYAVEQTFMKSKDGTQVPLSIVFKKDLKRDGNNPTYLYGYGGFGISETPVFRTWIAVWLEMGGVYADANIRGGGEYGKKWHEAGRRLSKQNSFDDFIAAAEWLIENKFTCSRKLAIGGGSNGGLLVGACMVQRPELFGACLPWTGLYDMIRYNRFRNWTTEYGTPDDPGDFEVLLSYSPYHNVRPDIIYPSALISTGDHDDRVFPAHSYKFAAALQSAQAGEGPILLQVAVNAGHGFGKPLQKAIDERADWWAFLFLNLDMDTSRVAWAIT